jgi:nitrate reductase NapAB chaperone NapD
MTNATSTLVVPTNPTDLKAIKDAIKEMSDCMLRIESEREQMKEIVNMVVEKYELPAGAVKKMATIYHKATYDKVVAEQSDFQSLYEAVQAAK